MQKQNLPMSKFFTLSFILNAYRPGQKKTTQKLQSDSFDDEVYLQLLDENGFEPSKRSVDAVLNFARQYEVYESETTGSIELSMN